MANLKVLSEENIGELGNTNKSFFGESEKIKTRNNKMKEINKFYLISPYLIKNFFKIRTFFYFQFILV